MKKKGSVQQLGPLVIGLVALGIMLVVSFLILAEVKSNSMVSADANATAGVNKTLDAMDDIPGWLPIIVITLIGALLIAIVSIFRSR